MHIDTLPFSLPPDDASREPCTHLSDIIKFMLINRDPKRYGRDITEATRVLWEAGFSWEEVLGHAWARRSAGTLLTQQPLNYEGVAMTPDAIDIKAWELDEYKFTRYSDEKTIEHPLLRHWWWQAMGYLKALDMTVVNWYVLHFMHDRATPRHYRVTFTNAELDANWRMLMVHRKKLEGTDAWKQTLARRVREHGIYLAELRRAGGSDAGRERAREDRQEPFRLDGPRPHPHPVRRPPPGTPTQPDEDDIPF